MTNFTGLIINSPPELAALKKRLALIVHVKKCSNALCNADSCVRLQKVINVHLANCTSGSNCNVTSCFTSRKLLDHQKDCQNTFCILCAHLPNFEKEFQPAFNDRHSACPTHQPWNLKVKNFTPYQPLVEPISPIQLHEHPFNFDNNYQTPKITIYPQQVTRVTPSATVTSTQMNSISSSDVTNLEQQAGIKNCPKCGMHGRKIDIKGHKNACPFANCRCDKCQYLEIKFQRAAQKRAMAKERHSNVVAFLGGLHNQPIEPLQPMLKLTKIDTKVSEENMNDTVNENGALKNLL
jgi:hypothetical protein